MTKKTQKKEKSKKENICVAKERKIQITVSGNNIFSA